LWLIISGPDALLEFIILIISTISSVVMTMSRRKLSAKYNSGWRTRGDSLRRQREVWITK
jgi:uncharacterized membrane protein